MSFESRYENGDVKYPLGQGAAGQLSYEAVGNMSALLMQPDRPAFASGDMRRGTDAEVRAAFEGFIGYFGGYTVDQAKGTVTHHVRGATYPNWVGGDQVRHFKLDGNRLTLSTPPILFGGQRSEAVRVWGRVQ